MTDRMKEMALRQLEKKTSEINFRGDSPDEGWIRKVRKALGMTVSQLADRLGVSQPTVSEYEAREAEGTITLNSLREAGQALECKLVYALLPRGHSFEEIREQQARVAAEKMVERTTRSMELEAQGVDPREKEAQVEDLKEELLAEWDNSIWDIESK